MENNQLSENISPRRSRTTTIWLVAVIAILAVVGYWFLVRNKAPVLDDLGPTVSPTASASVTASPIPTATGSISTVKTFNVVGRDFSFTPNEIKVKKGDRVRIVFRSEDGFHDWVVDEFNARTKRVGSGVSDTIEFTADKIGQFEFYCSVGSHRAAGMVGKLIVE